QTKLGEAVQALGLPGIHAITRHIEFRTFAPKPGGVLRRVPSRDRTYAATRSAKIIPHCIGAFAQRCDNTQSSDDHASFTHGGTAHRRPPACASSPGQPTMRLRQATTYFAECSLM